MVVNDRYCLFYICYLLLIFYAIISNQNLTRFREKPATQGRCHLDPDLTWERFVESYLQNKSLNGYVKKNNNYSNK